MAAATRGSDKLVSQQLSKADLARIVSAVKAGGSKLVDWHILGQPGPETVIGAIEVPAGKAGSVISKILATKLRPRFDVFPYGIPNPDRYTIRFRF